MKSCIRLALLAIVTVGCLDDRPTVPAAPTPAIESSRGSAQAVVLLEPGATATSAVLTVHVLSTDVTLGAYQGSMTFDADAFEIVEANMPSSAVGQFNVVNVTGAAGGVIRFAGYATEKFASDEAFHLRVRPKRDLSAVNFVTRLEVAGSMTGVSLHKDHLQTGRGLRDARSGALLSR